MSERKPFLVRLPADLHAVLVRWAADDLRSLNAQLEFILRQAASDAGRIKPREKGEGKLEKGERT